MSPRRPDIRHGTVNRGRWEEAWQEACDRPAPAPPPGQTHRALGLGEGGRGQPDAKAEDGRPVTLRAPRDPHPRKRTPCPGGDCGVQAHVVR